MQVPGCSGLHGNELVRALHAAIEGERSTGRLVAALHVADHAPRHREQRRHLAPHRPPLRLAARLRGAGEAVLDLRPEHRQVRRQRAPEVALGEKQVRPRRELQRRLRLDEAQVLLQAGVGTVTHFQATIPKK